MKRFFMLMAFGLFLLNQSQAHVKLKNPVGSEVYQPGDTVKITWEISINHDLQNWDLYYSTDDGMNWNQVRMDIYKGTFEFLWVVPNMPTTQAKIRIVMDNSGTDYQAVSRPFTIAIPTGSPEPDQVSAIQVFPNPMIEFTYIAFDNPENESHTLVLYDVQGRLVREITNITSDKIELKRKDLLSGLYFYQLITDNTVRATGKLTVN
jgi:Secretion system C-terminal sorting domain